MTDELKIQRIMKTQKELLFALLRCDGHFIHPRQMTVGIAKLN